MARFTLPRVVSGFFFLAIELLKSIKKPYLITFLGRIDKE